MKKVFLVRIFVLLTTILLTLTPNQKIIAGVTIWEKYDIDSIAPDTTGMGSLNAVDFAKKFYRGWNLGNSLEAIGGETAWGNPLTTQNLIDSVKVAGFNAIRIPVAWSRFYDTSTYIIDTTWLDRVEEVVNYALSDSMYVIINEHWDGGWMQPTYAQQDYVRNRFKIMWQQIAVHFRDYDNHLLFAGTNEVMKEGDYGTPTEEYYTVQNGFNQLFVNTVRSTGGRNTYRYLVVQGFNTNIDYTEDYFVAPQDIDSNRLMVEVHYYDPYNFTINSNSSLYVWGDNAPNSESWANESHADDQFLKMKTNFIDNNYAVILGEYCAMARLDLGEENNDIHAMYRLYWMQYITRSILQHGLVPFYWDSGYTGNDASGLFNRATGVQAYPDIIKAIIDTSNVTVPVFPPNVVSATAERNLKLYPNPVNSIVNIELTSTNKGIIKMYDSEGLVLKILNLESDFNAYDLSDLRPGLYLIQLLTSEGFFTQKFLKN
jgi:endoglucanase